MRKYELEQRLGQLLSFLERGIQESHVIALPPAPKDKEYLPAYHVNLGREEAYRRAEEELRKLFPEIDFYSILKDANN